MMDAMEDLVTWLRGQLDEDERVANEMGELDSTARNGIESTAGYGALQLVDRFDRKRLLREVEAKRRIIDSWEASQDDNFPPLALIALDEVVKALALPFADRPGYREEWRP